ncbi:hypothetical protein Skr01_68720 [Sphaerisporangium krabiense]|uniref:CBU-0592-like domain-containing protein n=1 Tax=Sphaerisporangium krabiense TaxID=763782 RepID=A0A7W8Z3W4_9ACTN|nr:hypothetical protein [Sphaerisporangium krabiense]MBB5626984.1 hypothetical protein [Sphaerisporangium krabiense]GII66787.1 hypothetical protein Skr01_68720 [Sphaerisporangium krabiense]
MDQIIQIAGAIAVLAAFVLAQFQVLRPRSVTYLALNLAGSAVLAVIALTGRDWGFVLLEGVWALVSGAGLIRALTGADTSGGDAGKPV